MQYGFVLDQGACIGCHACTVACKAENDVPLGSFRTWVKWVEHGAFPETKRSAAVLRCNHCVDAPCIEICPTVALSKRPDGIVDLDEDRCIGCASCIQACPYDAIYLDDRSGTAAKCHFCAHRIEVGLAPACVAVCPEEAIKVVDFDNPNTRVELGRRGAVARKTDRGTKPRTFYLGADPVALDPLGVDGSRTLSHAEVPDPMPALSTLAARAVYDVPRQRYWGSRITAYLVTKAIAAGALLGAAITPWANPGTDGSSSSTWALAAGDARWLGALSLLFIAVTAILLIMDLHKPARFYFLLTKANPRSWLVRGGVVLALHGALSLPWIFGLSHPVLGVASAATALMTAIYTAFLFRQARGRELWCEDPTLPWVLGLQATAALAVLAWLTRPGWSPWVLGLAGAYLGVMVLATFLPARTDQARRAHRWMVSHPIYRLGLAAAGGAVLVPPLALVAFGLFDWIYVKAGQEVPLS